MKGYLDILKVVWPLALGMLNNAVLEFTDRAFLAHDSLLSLEAVMPASMLSLIALGFFQAIVAYSGTFVAQYHGAKDGYRTTLSYHAGVWIALFSGLAMLSLLPVGGWVFENFSSGAEVIAREKTYYSICTGGGVFLFGFMAVQSYFTGIGKTRIIFWVNIFGNCLNVLLDWVMIFGHWGCPALGIAGAAYATVLATLAQWGLLALAARRHLAGNPAPWRLNGELWALIRRILRFGVPSGGYNILNLSSFTIFIFIISRVGHLEAAVSNACFSVNYLLFAPIDGFALGAQTLVGQRQGAGDHDGAARVGWRTLKLALLINVAEVAGVLVFHRPILELFASEAGPEASRFCELGFQLCLVMGGWQLFDVADVVLSGALKGAGDTKFVFWWIFIMAYLVWLPIVFAVSAFHSTMPALWATNLIYVAILCAGTLWRWAGGSWRRIQMV